MKRNIKKNKLIRKGSVTGIAVSIAMILALSFVCAFFSEKGILSKELLDISIIASCVISGFIGGCMSWNGDIKSVLICTAVLVSIKALSAMAGEGSIVSKENITVFIALAAGSLAGGITMMKSKRKKRR